MKHGPQTTPRRGRRELAACALTERVIASRALTFHRVMHPHAFFSCNAYLETLRYVPESARPDRYENVTQSPRRLELRRTLRHTSTPDIMANRYVYRDKARHPRARGGVVYLAYVPYLGNLCHRRMLLCAGETACADPSSSPLPFCRFLCSSETP